MKYTIVSKLGRAGNKQNRLNQSCKWDLLYGKNNWEVVYKVKDKIYSREKALSEFYNKSYYIYLKEHPDVTDELCNMAKEIYNPHALNTGGVDLQCPAVLLALDKLNKKLIGKERIAIGTWGTKYGKVYPDISEKLSPYKVPIWFDKTISVEQFWQKNKYLAKKN